MPKKLIHLIAGARPNFMKIAPLYHALNAREWADPRIIHTGQHYDAQLSDSFFEDLSLPTPNHHLEVGSGTHGVQTARTMTAYEEVCQAESPDLVIVVGDVNSTIACALVAKKLHRTVAHLEAGLRSGDRTMPEEINRLATDAISDIFWTPSADADDHLRHEGHDDAKIVRVGNVMMDAYELVRDKIALATPALPAGLKERPYAVVTLHRPSNVDTKGSLELLVNELGQVSKEISILFPIHPRTRARLNEFGLMEALEKFEHFHLTDPVGYIDFMSIVSGAKLAITDSGGLQEETTYLGIPCLTVRENTERPITLTEGTNRLISPSEIASAFEEVQKVDFSTAKCPDMWDGRTAERICDYLERESSFVFGA